VPILCKTDHHLNRMNFQWSLVCNSMVCMDCELHVGKIDIVRWEDWRKAVLYAERELAIKELES